MATRGRKADIELAIKQLEEVLDVLYGMDGVDERVFTKINRAINLMDRQYSDDYNADYRPINFDNVPAEDVSWAHSLLDDDENNDEDR